MWCCPEVDAGMGFMWRCPEVDAGRFGLTLAGHPSQESVLRSSGI
jgi:hypothetical protein